MRHDTASVKDLAFHRSLFDEGGQDGLRFANVPGRLPLKLTVTAIQSIPVQSFVVCVAHSTEITPMGTEQGDLQEQPRPPKTTVAQLVALHVRSDRGTRACAAEPAALPAIPSVAISWWTHQMFNFAICDRPSDFDLALALEHECVQVANPYSCALDESLMSNDSVCAITMRRLAEGTPRTEGRPEAAYVGSLREQRH